MGRDSSAELAGPVLAEPQANQHRRVVILFRTIAFLLGLLAPSLSTEFCQGATPPNMVVILVDEEGMRFQTCYATPICSASRALLLTGRDESKGSGVNKHKWLLKPACLLLPHGEATGGSGGVTGQAKGRGVISKLPPPLCRTPDRRGCQRRAV